MVRRRFQAFPQNAHERGWKLAGLDRAQSLAARAHVRPLAATGGSGLMRLFGRGCERERARPRVFRAASGVMPGAGATPGKRPRRPARPDLAVTERAASQSPTPQHSRLLWLAPPLETPRSHLGRNRLRQSGSIEALPVLLPDLLVFGDPAGRCRSGYSVLERIRHWMSWSTDTVFTMLRPRQDRPPTEMREARRPKRAPATVFHDRRPDRTPRNVARGADVPAIEWRASGARMALKRGFSVRCFKPGLDEQREVSGR